MVTKRSTGYVLKIACMAMVLFSALFVFSDGRYAFMTGSSVRVFAAEGEKPDSEEKAKSVDSDSDPGEETAPKPVLRNSSVTLYTGWESFEIFVDNIDEEAQIKYKSTDKKVAKVDEDGEVTPVNTGSAKIKVTVTDAEGNVTKLKLTVKVKEPYYKVTASTDAITTHGDYRFSVKRYGYEDEVEWFLTGSQYAHIKAVSDTDCVISGKKTGDVVLSVVSRGRREDFNIHVYEGYGPAYRITPEKAPYNDNYVTRGEFNEYTRDYFVARSYLEKLAVQGGGLLIFSKGDYSFTNTLCIPSNTTVLIEDGAVLRKSDYTGSKWLEATQSLFQTVSPYHTQTKFTEYNGEHDIVIKGEGSATIDLNFVKATAITAAHCSRLTISGIRFRNLNSLHFIELDASRDVDIFGNHFSGCVASPTLRKEAINLDTPDELTHGFSQGWTSYDKTPDLNVSIFDNVFEELETAIGTHKYSEGMYHTNIVIERNTFVNVTTYVVRMMNWKDSVIKDNYFLLFDRPTDRTVNAVILNGAVNPTVTQNSFRNFTTAITCSHWKNSGAAKVYAETYNKLSKANIKVMKDNYAEGCENDYFEVYEVYGDTTGENLKTYTFSN